MNGTARQAPVRLDPDRDEMSRALSVLTVMPEQVIELRALGVSTHSYRKPHTEAGYFDANHLENLVAAAAGLNPNAPGVYVSLNPVDPALQARAYNRTSEVGGGDATSDKDIVARKWLVVDVDPCRPSGICATTDEREHAHHVAQSVYQYLVHTLDWPEPVVVDSGNGFYGLWRIDLPPEDSGLVSRCLTALSAMFDTPQAHIDTGMFNPARIIRLPGTVNRKGDSTEGRPHRLSSLMHVPTPLHVVNREQLEALAATLPPESERSTSGIGARFDLAAFISRNNLDVGTPRPWKDGTRWVFNICPFDSAHTNRSAVLLQFGSGAVAFRCQHNSCAGNDWAALRSLYEPKRDPHQGWHHQNGTGGAAEGQQQSDQEAPGVALFADCCVGAARRWNPPLNPRGEPKVHFLAWAIAGTLLGDGFNEEQVTVLLTAAGARFDKPVRQAMRWDDAARTTAAKIAEAAGDSTKWIGAPRLAELSSAQDVQAIRALARVAFPHEGASPANTKYRDMGEDWGLVRPRPRERAAFPLDTLPEGWPRQLVQDAATSLRAPLDFTAAAFMACTAVALAGSMRQHIMNTFAMYPSLWLVLVGPPGCGKGPPYKLFTAPLLAWQGIRYQAYRAESERYQQDLAAWEALTKQNKATTPRPKPPVWLPISVDDTTLEALGAALEAVPRGVGLLNEESAGFIKGMGQYKKGGGHDQEQWQRIADNAAITITRVPVIRHIPNPVVPLFGTTQPEVITPLLRRNHNGLCERFLFVYPHDPGLQALKECPPLAEMARYRGLIALLLALDLEPQMEGRAPRPRLFHLSREAKRTWTCIEEQFVKQYGAADVDPKLRGSYAKGRGMAARLTGLLHVLRYLAPLAPALDEDGALDAGQIATLRAAIPDEADSDTVKKAWQQNAYYLDHAGALEHEAGHGDDARIDRVVTWLEKQPDHAATLREMVRAKLAGSQSAPATKELVDVLEARGLVRQEERTVGGVVSVRVVLAELEPES